MSVFRARYLAGAPLALACALAVLPVPPAAGASQNSAVHTDLSGTWTFKSDLSDHPQEIAGFGRGDTSQPRPSEPGGGFGGRGGGRGGFGRGGFGGGRGGRLGAAGRGNADDRLRVLELTDEIRNPPQTLTIAQRGDTVSITGAENTTRVFHANGKKETQQLPAVKIDSRTRWDGDGLITDYDAGSGRTIRFTYSLLPESGQLVVEAVFVAAKQSGQPAAIKRVYDLSPAASR